MEKLCRLQCTISEKMHKKMCILADAQGIKVTVLYRNILMNWYEEKYQHLSTIWEVNK